MIKFSSPPCTFTVAKKAVNMISLLQKLTILVKVLIDNRTSLVYQLP